MGRSDPLRAHRSRHIVVAFGPDGTLARGDRTGHSYPQDLSTGDSPTQGALRASAAGRLLDNGIGDHDADSGQDGVPVEAFWESFRLDPRQPAHASMRASDADREIVCALLTDAYADGRLTREEYDDRLNILYASRTLGDMPALVTDLVPPDGAPAAPAPPLPPDLRTRGARKWRRDVEESFGAFLVPSIIYTVIWVAVSGGGFFWPVFPILFLGLNLVKTVVQRESVIEREVRRLEEQAAKDAAPELPAGRGDPDEAKEG